MMFRSIFFFVIFGVLAGWSVGLMSFSENIPNYVTDNTTKTDVVVVLTGGVHRIATGVKLVEAGMGKVLFISGVNERVRPEDLVKNKNIPVVLGYKARTTEENVREVLDWIQKTRYQSLRVVTSNYHIPRTKLLFKRLFPNIKIVYHPVMTDGMNFRRWWKDPKAAKLAISEYHKFMFTLLLQQWQSF